MFDLQAPLEYKAGQYNLANAEICAVERISHKRFIFFSQCLLDDADFISAHKDEMGLTSDGISRTLLVLDSDSQNGILVESEGNDYASQSAWLPGIKPWFYSQMRQLASKLIADCVKVAEKGNWRITTEEADHRYGVHLSGSDSLCNELSAALFHADEVAKVAIQGGVIEMKLYPEFYCSASPVAIQALSQERKQELLERLANYMGEHFDDSQLYDILHDTLEISHAEIAGLGFSLRQDSQVQETGERGPMMSV